ncbi:hypothetical protein G8764_13910 [Pseudomaricurvus alcaniphilus]|uniref:hypothetical protein n=1 Tax=Pseudomaricurvus alcaniphilus TaxID=1166482 RepID=UPI00140D776F|nr:hypothetical protein [Pseudomaricurvus alcaniphilus]NHN38398.1 hypothetical protein [Pseudomaricurvus alcaniphilus]
MQRRKFLKKSSALGLFGILPMQLSAATAFNNFLTKESSTKGQLWKDPSASAEERANDLLSRMTIDEKVSFCGSRIPAIERLGIPFFEWYG